MTSTTNPTARASYEALHFNCFHRLDLITDAGCANGAFTPSADLPILAEGKVDVASLNNRANYRREVCKAWDDAKVQAAHLAAILTLFT